MSSICLFWMMMFIVCGVDLIGKSNGMQCYDDPVEDKRKGCASHEQCVKYSCSGVKFAVGAEYHGGNVNAGPVVWTSDLNFAAATCKPVGVCDQDEFMEKRAKCEKEGGGHFDCNECSTDLCNRDKDIECWTGDHNKGDHQQKCQPGHQCTTTGCKDAGGKFVSYEKTCKAPGYCDPKAFSFGSKCNTALNESDYCTQCRFDNCNKDDGLGVGGVVTTQKPDVGDSDPPPTDPVEPPNTDNVEGGDDTTTAASGAIVESVMVPMLVMAMLSGGLLLIVPNVID